MSGPALLPLLCAVPSGALGFLNFKLGPILHSVRALGGADFQQYAVAHGTSSLTSDTWCF